MQHACHGSERGKPGLAGCSRVQRDDKGVVKGLFSGPLGVMNSNKDELQLTCWEKCSTPLQLFAMVTQDIVSNSFTTDNVYVVIHTFDSNHIFSYETFSYCEKGDQRAKVLKFPKVRSVFEIEEQRKKVEVKRVRTIFQNQNLQEKNC